MLSIDFNKHDWTVENLIDKNKMFIVYMLLFIGTP